MSRVVSVSRDELIERRRKILLELGVSYEEFRSLAERSALVGREWEAWQALVDIGFLLGDE